MQTPPARNVAALLSGAALLLAASLAAERRTSIRAKILSGPKRGEVILQRIDRQRYRHRQIDRTTLAGGEVSFEFLQTVPALYRLRLPRDQRLDVALRPGQRLELEYDPRTGAFSSTGSPDTAELRAGIAFSNDYVRRELAAPSERYSAAAKKKDPAAVAAAEAELREARKAWFAALVEHAATLDSPLAVYGLFTLYDWNDQIGDYDLSGIAAVREKLAAANPDSVGVELLGDVIDRYRGTAVGAVLPDVTLKDPDGRIIRVSDLRGRYVLVDVWASGCAPCRQESPNRVRNYEKYKDEGFTIYSISFNDARDRWLKAIRKDGLDWPYQVSDLEGSHSEATYVYATAPPSSFLLDPEGRILAKNLHGEALGRELAAIYGY